MKYSFIQVPEFPVETAKAVRQSAPPEEFAMMDKRSTASLCGSSRFTSRPRRCPEHPRWKLRSRCF